MGVINLSYNKNLVDVLINQDSIIIKDKNKNLVLYCFPFPKDFSFLGISNIYYGKDKPTIVIAPYKLEYPKYIPEGYGNLQLSPCGLYSVEKENEKEKNLYYIDTSFLTSKDFEFPSSGKFKILEKDIPASFWVSAPGFGKGCKASKIEDKVKEFDSNARLIYEEEVMCIFALQDYKSHFMENISKDTYFSMHQPPKFVVQMGSYSLDFLTIIALSRENRKIYREMQHYWNREFVYNPIWYINRSFTESDRDNDSLNNIYIYSVLEDKTKDVSLSLKKLKNK